MQSLTSDVAPRITASPQDSPKAQFCTALASISHDTASVSEYTALVASYNTCYYPEVQGQQFFFLFTKLIVTVNLVHCCYTLYCCSVYIDGLYTIL